MGCRSWVQIWLKFYPCNCCAACTNVSYITAIYRRESVVLAYPSQNIPAPATKGLMSCIYHGFPVHMRLNVRSIWWVYDKYSWLLKMISVRIDVEGNLQTDKITLSHLRCFFLLSFVTFLSHFRNIPIKTPPKLGPRESALVQIMVWCRINDVSLS